MYMDFTQLFFGNMCYSSIRTKYHYLWRIDKTWIWPVWYSTKKIHTYFCEMYIPIQKVYYQLHWLCWCVWLC